MGQNAQQPRAMFEADSGTSLSHPHVVQTFKSHTALSKVAAGICLRIYCMPFIIMQALGPTAACPVVTVSPVLHHPRRRTASRTRRRGFCWSSVTAAACRMPWTEGPSVLCASVKRALRCSAHDVCASVEDHPHALIVPHLPVYCCRPISRQYMPQPERLQQAWRTCMLTTSCTVTSRLETFY